MGGAEDALITADVGVEATVDLVEELRGEAEQGRITSGADLSRALWEAIAARMAADPPRIPLVGSPTVVLIVGVNGSGKTTTIGKLAHRLAELDQRVVIGAADTFRAAAIDQLAVWADRSGRALRAPVPGRRPRRGRLRRRAIRGRGADVVLIDTAGGSRPSTTSWRSCARSRRSWARSTPTPPTRSCWCSTRPPARTGSARRGCSTRPPT